MPREVIEAAGVIEEAGFTIIDDLLHGYGGGYLPPILGSQSRPSAHVPDEPFRAGMVVVIQPNVVTTDGKAGVQTGEMVLITETGIEPMHAVPRGFCASDRVCRMREPRKCSRSCRRLTAAAHRGPLKKRAPDARRVIINRNAVAPALEAFNARMRLRGSRAYLTPRVHGRADSNFVKDISSLQSTRYTRCKEYRFNQSSA